MGAMVSKNKNNNGKGRGRNHDMVRPSSPPRGLATILRSQSLSEEFHDFLKDLDEDAEEGRLRQLWLDFVTSARGLRDLTESGQENNVKKLIIIHLKNMEDNFFNAKDSRKRLALSNPALWTACHNLCLKAKANSDLSPIWKAHDEVVRKLDDIHQPFLIKRHEEQSNNSSTASRILSEQIQQCLL